MEISSNSGTDCSHTWRVLVRIIRDEYRVTRFRNKNRWSRLKIKVGTQKPQPRFLLTKITHRVSQPYVLRIEQKRSAECHLASSSNQILATIVFLPDLLRMEQFH